ncbi:hypothetical protein EVAR_15971_1 [Eumeta japonica]|uniref:Uncharacterized protein n=1 Tax=Eumeta variegata TaxID=151549 RepID=A0A4C1UL64_EUMVA|nr:hypothetical protein EVAR_15971_1 [Eumeta japonica]
MDEQVQGSVQETVEKWLPIHAACIGGHSPLVSLLLEYPYPEEALNSYTDPTGQWQYRFAFDVNARDVSGQTPLYVACTLGNFTIVDVLLKHSVVATKIASAENDREARSPSPKKQEVLSPNRSGISLGIHAIVSKLTGQSNTKSESTDIEPKIHPVNVEAGRPGDSCLGAAVRGGHARVAQRLLAAGADVDAPCKPPDKLSQIDHDNRRRRSSSALPGRSSTSPSPCRTAYNEREGTWTPLAVAARAKNAQLLQLLLSHGATDTHCLALRECARNGMETMLATLLATKAYPDPDYKINKNGVAETVFSGRDGDSTLTYNALSPSTPVMVSWRELHCQIAKIRMKWIREAALRINPKLGKAAVALHAVTRIDISNNELRLLPPELFALVSLRYLNAAQNKLERLPLPSDPLEEEEDLAQRTKRRPKRSFKFRPEVYSAPVLEELYLQDNRLEELPAGIFFLPSLVTLDVSNNKLRALPSAIWSAPKLRDLNVALNHLKELPLREQVQADGTVQSPTCSSAEPSPQIGTSSPIGQMSQFIFMNSVSCLCVVVRGACVRGGRCSGVWCGRQAVCGRRQHAYAWRACVRA